jgi:DNA-binding response OmpR family regulator
MAVLLLSTDPDFRSALTYCLRFHGFGVTPVPFDDVTVPPFSTEPRPVMVVDLSEEESLFETAGRATRYTNCPLLVLSRPGALMASARQLLPDASAYLPVPVLPSELVGAVRTVSGTGLAAQNYALVEL